MTKLRLKSKIFVSSLLTSSLLAPFSSLVRAQSNINPVQLSQLNGVIGKVISVVIWAVGLISLAMLLIGGFKYLSAGADKNSTDQARNTIMYAIGGLIIAISAWVILVMIGRFFGIPTGVFDICIDPLTC